MKRAASGKRPKTRRLLQPQGSVRVNLAAMQIAIDGVGVEKDTVTGEFVVKVRVGYDQLHEEIEVIRIGHDPFANGIVSHWTTASGIRQKIHKATDGCDMRQDIDGKGRLLCTPCTRPNHV